MEQDGETAYFGMQAMLNLRYPDRYTGETIGEEMERLKEERALRIAQIKPNTSY
ncbi:MAG: hypothetical protein ABH817_00720 [archaeon]